MKVLKFGGSSVGSTESIKKVLDIVKGYKNRNEEIAVVVSAMQGVTNQLIELGNMAAISDEGYLDILKEIEERHFNAIKDIVPVKAQSKIFAKIKILLNELEDLLHGVYLLKELSPRSLDLVLSFGERLSAFLISEYFKQENIESEFLDARKLIKTDKNFGSARINFPVSDNNIINYFAEHKSLQVITGFIGSTEKDETTTLGRGGSDYTASVFGAALNATDIEIWTDVDGVMTADPRKVKRAFSLDSLSYIEAMEMSHFGAKVIYPPTLQPAFSKNIPLWIKNTFNPGFAGTYISQKTSNKDLIIKGISSIQDVALINIQGSGMIGVPGVASRVFGALARVDINVILITQASSEYSICFALDPLFSSRAKEVIEEDFANEIRAGKIDKIVIENSLSVVAIIGENMRNTTGISGKLFSALGKNGINIVAIAQGSSELNLSVVIYQSDLSKALNALHEAFFLSDTRTLNIFLVGLGLIGGTLLEQIKKQANYLREERLLNINIIGIANSKKMFFNEDGIDISFWKENIQTMNGKTSLDGFVAKMKELNLPNSIFVDCTSSEEVIKYYKEILKSSISIVTPNKLANSSSFNDYQKLQKTAFRYGVKFLYETNVGAGLPVINTLKDLKYSGDQILKIEGILSGTLSYIFNTFKEGENFSDVVKEAKKRGFTEPDPRDDLNGKDVARKILILSREAGLSLEPEEIVVENILPEACLKAKNVEEFFEQLEKANPEFEKRRKDAENNGQVLRFIASLESGRAKVSLEAVDSTHPFYNLSGSDNIVSYTTERYKDRPLVVKGPGAGAEVTAAGVFAEIISIGNYFSQDNINYKKRS
ncbi:MAG: bifunctional aspartate kinase/homoserine dehydrogenase I [Bacteroidota bacterium]|nr:bifunctional aspartate kinase/homoserine dehydrogenase I [Bacteroidota bacterium]